MVLLRLEAQARQLVVGMTLAVGREEGHSEGGKLTALLLEQGRGQEWAWGS